MRFNDDIKYLFNGVKYLFGNRPSSIRANEHIRRRLSAALEQGKILGRRQMMYGPGADTGVLRGDWRTAIKPIASVIREDSAKVWARAEELFRTYPIARRALTLFGDGVVNNGIRPYAAIRYANGDQPRLVNERLDQDWERFVDQGVRNGTCELSYYQSQKLDFLTMGEYGTVLANVVNSKPGSLLPYAFQPLKPTRLDFSKDTMFEYNNTITSFDKKKIIHGIEINDYAEAKAFHLLGMDNPVSADNMMMSFFPIEIEQFLGLSWLYPVMCAMWDHDQLFSDKLKQSRIGSKLGMKFAREDRQGLDNLLKSGEAGVDYLELDFQGMYFGKDKPEPIAITDPISDTFKPLVDMIMGYIAMGMGFSYQAFTTDLNGANFSSARTNTIGDNRTFTGAFKKFIDFCGKPKRNKFVEWEVMTGRLAEFGITPAVYNRDRWYYNQSIWLPMDYQEWVDPLNDQQALILAYKSGQITYRQLCARSGKNLSTQLKEIAEERADLISAGLRHLLPENISASPSQSPAQNQNKKQESNVDVNQ